MSSDFELCVLYTTKYSQNYSGNNLPLPKHVNVSRYFACPDHELPLSGEVVYVYSSHGLQDIVNHPDYSQNVLSALNISWK